MAPFQDLTNVPRGRANSPVRGKANVPPPAREDSRGGVAQGCRGGSGQCSTSGRGGTIGGVPDWTSMSDFLITRKLGSTLMSTVFLARCKRTGMLVAIKVYRKAALDQVARGQVYREIAALQTLRHSDHINKLYTVLEDPHHIRLVLEYCPGGDLLRLKNNVGGRFPEAQVAQAIVRPLLLALRDSHAQSILHRDVKPENLFLAASGNVQLGDFGLSICTAESQPKSVVGTLDYIAPEVLRMSDKNVILAPEAGVEPSKGYDHKADVWSLGVSAFELLTGRPPFEVPSRGATKRGIMTLPLPLGGATQHLSKDCVDFLLATTAKDPAKRPTITELLRHPWLNSSSTPFAFFHPAVLRTLLPHPPPHHSAPAALSPQRDDHSAHPPHDSESVSARVTRAVESWVACSSAASWTSCFKSVDRQKVEGSQIRAEKVRVVKGRVDLPAPLRAPPVHFMPRRSAGC